MKGEAHGDHGSHRYPGLHQPARQQRQADDDAQRAPLNLKPSSGAANTQEKGQYAGPRESGASRSSRTPWLRILTKMVGRRQTRVRGFLAEESRHHRQESLGRRLRSTATSSAINADVGICAYAESFQSHEDCQYPSTFFSGHASLSRFNTFRSPASRGAPAPRRR